MPPYRPDPLAGVDRIRGILAGAGLTEVVTHALIAPHDHALIGIDDGDGHSIRVTNPLSVDHSVLRRMLLPGLLHALSVNERVRRPDVALFEIGEVCRTDDGRPREQARLGLLLAGEVTPAAWNQPARPADLWELRGLIELLVRGLGGPTPRFEPRRPVHGVEHPGRVAGVVIPPGESVAGPVAELHPGLLEAFEIRAERVAWAELDLASLLGAGSAAGRHRPLPRQPAAERDLAVVVPEATLAGEVAKRIGETAGGALIDLALFDIYRGAPLADREKSLAYRLHLDADDEARPPDAVIEAVRAALERAGWRPRT